MKSLQTNNSSICERILINIHSLPSLSLSIYWLTRKLLSKKRHGLAVDAKQFSYQMVKGIVGGWDRWKRGEISIGEQRISRGGRSIDRLIDLSGTMGLRGQRWIFALMNFIPRIISNTDLKWIQDNDVYEVLGWLALGLLSILVRLIAKSCARFFSNPRVFAGNPSGRNFNSPWNFKKLALELCEKLQELTHLVINVVVSFQFWFSKLLLNYSSTFLFHLNLHSTSLINNNKG